MKLEIYCPVCSNKISNKIEFSPLTGRDRDLDCNNCNSVFSVRLQTSDGVKVKRHDDLLLGLIIDFDKNYSWLNIDKPTPDLFCALHSGKSRIGKLDENLFSGKCRSCGAQYQVEFAK